MPWVYAHRHIYIYVTCRPIYHIYGVGRHTRAKRFAQRAKRFDLEEDKKKNQNELIHKATSCRV